MSVVVLGGCGDMGSFTTRDLVKFTNVNVVIADYRKEAAEKLAAEFGERARGLCRRNERRLAGASFAGRGRGGGMHLSFFKELARHAVKVYCTRAPIAPFHA